MKSTYNRFSVHVHADIYLMSRLIAVASSGERSFVPTLIFP
jgi:hypothetical protein